MVRTQTPPPQPIMQSDLLGFTNPNISSLTIDISYTHFFLHVFLGKSPLIIIFGVFGSGRKAFLYFFFETFYLVKLRNPRVITRILIHSLAHITCLFVTPRDNHPSCAYPHLRIHNPHLRTPPSSLLHRDTTPRSITTLLETRPHHLLSYQVE